MPDEDIKISAVPTADAFTANDILTGVRNSAGTFSNKNYTAAQLAAYVLANSRKKITAASANISGSGKVLTDAFFSNTIEEISTGGQTYLRDEDFTQSGTAITATQFAFYDGQKLTAKL